MELCGDGSYQLGLMAPNRMSGFLGTWIDKDTVSYTLKVAVIHITYNTCLKLGFFQGLGIHPKYTWRKILTHTNSKSNPLFSFAKIQAKAVGKKSPTWHISHVRPLLRLSRCFCNSFTAPRADRSSTWPNRQQVEANPWKKGQQIISPSTCAPSTSGKSVAVVLSDLRRLGDPSRPRSRGLRSSLFCDLGDSGDTGGSRSPAPGDPAPPLVLMALVRASGAKLGTTEKGAGARGLVMPIITQAPAQHPAPVPPWRKDDVPYAGRRVLYTYIYIYENRWWAENRRSGHGQEFGQRWGPNFENFQPVNVEVIKNSRNKIQRHKGWRIAKSSSCTFSSRLSCKARPTHTHTHIYIYISIIYSRKIRNTQKLSHPREVQFKVYWWTRPIQSSSSELSTIPHWSVSMENRPGNSQYGKSPCSIAKSSCVSSTSSTNGHCLWQSAIFYKCFAASSPDPDGDRNPRDPPRPWL